MTKAQESATISLFVMGGSVRKRQEFDAANQNLCAFRLQLNFSVSMGRVGCVIDHFTVHDVPDGIAIADNFLAVPLAGGRLDVLFAAETDLIFPFGVAA